MKHWHGQRFPAVVMRFKQHDLAPLRRDCASLAFRQKQGWCVQYEVAVTAASDATAIAAW